MKPGIKTTEFWLSLGAVVTAAALTHFEQVPGTVGVVTIAVLTAVYTILRAAGKNAAGK
jgi:hypothetical protein